jgi:aminopeptidase
MRDPRIDDYARLLVERSVPAWPGAQIVVRSTPLARPLIEAVVEEAARRGAYTLLQLAFELVGGPFAREAPLDLLREAPPLQRTIWERADGMIVIWAPENAREGAELSAERHAALQESVRPWRARTMAMEVPWVIAEYPTPAGAQDAGMSIGEYEDFIFEAVLRDWDGEAERMRRIADVFDATESCGSSARAPISRYRSPAASARSTPGT